MEVSAGSHPVDFNATDLAGGVYYYQLNINDKFVQSKKMMLLK